MTSYDLPQTPQPAPAWPYSPQSEQPQAPPRATKAGVETRQVLLTLGALCLIVAFSAGTALVWSRLGVDGQLLVMTGVTALLLLGAATLRRLPATAEALGAVGLTGCAVDAASARTLHLHLATAVPLHWYITGAALGIAAVSAVLWAARPSLISPRVVAGASTICAWFSLIAVPQVFADVDFVLAAGAVLVAFASPTNRGKNAALRNAAFGSATALGSIATTITLGLHYVTTPEAYVAAPSALALTWAAAALIENRHLSSAVLAPGLAIGLFPTFVLAFANDDGHRQLVLLVVATILVALGAELRLTVPLATGAALIGLLGVRVIGPELAQAPHWTMWAAAGTILLTLGATWESRLEDIRKLKNTLEPRIAALR